MDEANIMQLQLNSDPHYLCVVRLAVARLVEKLGFDEEDCTRITLAVDEAMTNIIRHGYEGATDRPIWVHIGRMDDPPGMRIVIEDRARQVEPDTICGRNLEDVRPGGLGVHIIKSAMDEVQYTPRPDGGMRLEMIRYCHPGEQQTAPSKKTG